MWTWKFLFPHQEKEQSGECWCGFWMWKRKRWDFNATSVSKSSVVVCDALFQKDYLPFVCEFITYNIKTSMRLHISLAEAANLTLGRSTGHTSLQQLKIQSQKLMLAAINSWNAAYICCQRPRGQLMPPWLGQLGFKIDFFFLSILCLWALRSSAVNHNMKVNSRLLNISDNMLEDLLWQVCFLISSLKI